MNCSRPWLKGFDGSDRTTPSVRTKKSDIIHKILKISRKCHHVLDAILELEMHKYAFEAGALFCPGPHRGSFEHSEIARLAEGRFATGGIESTLLGKVWLRACVLSKVEK